MIIGSSVVEKYDGRYVRLIPVCHSQDDTLFGIAVMLHFETDVHNVSENRMPVSEKSKRKGVGMDERGHASDD